MPADDLDRIEEHLRKVAEGERPFEIHLRGTGTFRPVSPVVFVSVVAGHQRLRAGRGAACAPARCSASCRSPTTRTSRSPTTCPTTCSTRAFDELAGYDVRFPVWGFSLYEHGADGVWRPQRDFPFGQPLPGPHPTRVSGRACSPVRARARP